MRRAAFKFRSTPFLGASFPNRAAVPFPQTSDSNMWVWYASDAHVSNVNATANTIYTLGNKAAWQVSKTDRTGAGTSNLVPYGGGYEPLLSRTDNKGNLAKSTEIINTGNWTASNVTLNSATTATFTAQNGELRQTLWAYSHEGKQLTVKFKMRNISGNTALQVRLEGSYTNFTIDSTLTEYSFTFTPSAVSAAPAIGVRDANAAGHGQFEITQFHVYISGGSTPWSSTYVKNDSVDEILPTTNPAGLPEIGMFNNRFFFHYNVGVNGYNNPACTIYCTYRANPWKYAGRLFTFTRSLYDMIISHEDASNKMRMYFNGPPTRDNYTGTNFVTDYEWCVLTWTITFGGACSVRKNLNTPVTGTSSNMSVGTQSLQWGSYSYDGAWSTVRHTELIWRFGIDSAATQEAYVRYLAGRIGITV